MMVLTAIFRMIMVPNLKVIYVAPSYEQAIKTILDIKINGEKIFNLIPKVLVKRYPTKTDMTLELVNGSIMRIMGSLDPDSLVGQSANIIVLEEATLQPVKIWLLLLPILILDPDCQMWVNGTPRAENLWLYNVIKNPPDPLVVIEDMYNQGKDETELLGITPEAYGELDFGVRHGLSKEEYDNAKKFYAETTFIDVQELDVYQCKIGKPEEIAMTRQTIIEATGSDKEFRQEFLLDWNVADANALFGEMLEEAQKEGRIAEWLPNPNYPVYAALDLGIGDKTVITVGQKIKSRVFILDVYASNSNTYGHYIDWMNKSKWNIKELFLPWDATMRNRENSRDAFAYFTNAMPDTKVRKLTRTKSVETDITKVQKYLDQVYFNKSANVDKMLKELRSYGYKKTNKGEITQTLMHSDYVDSFRYFILAMYEYLTISSLRSGNS